MATETKSAGFTPGSRDDTETDSLVKRQEYRGIHPKLTEKPDENETDGAKGTDVELDETLECLSPEEVEKERKGTVRQIVILSAAFVLLVAGMQGLVSLQSSLNAQLGVLGLGVNFAAVGLSCLFLSTFLVQRLGCKWAVVLGMSAMLVWMCANLYPVWWTILPASVIMGLGMAPLWTAQCTLFTVCGVRIASITGRPADVVIAKGFGFFFMTYMTGPIWGNLISSAILSQGIPDDVDNVTETVTLNGSALLTRVTISCGADFCPQLLKGLDGGAVHKPEWKWVRILVGIYLGLGLFGILLVLIFIPNIRAKDEHKRARFSLSLCIQTLQQLRNKLQLLMVPLNIYVGLEEGFMMAEFTMGFVTCALGVEKLGFVIIAYAIMAAIVSFSCGHLIRVVGRPVVFIAGGLSHVGCAVFMLTWDTDPSRPYIFVILSAFWGLGDAVLQSQMNAFYGTVFSDHSEAAFSNYRMWEAVGIIIALSYSSYICIRIKLYILMIVLAVGIFFYLATEILYRRQLREIEKEKSADEQEKEADDVPPLVKSASTNTFIQYTEMVRRKSSIFFLETTVKEATENLLRSSEDTMGEFALRRRLSIMFPNQADDDEKVSKPARKISEGVRKPLRDEGHVKPRRITVHEMPDRSQLETPRNLDIISEC